MGQGQQTVDAVLPILKDVLGDSGSSTLEPVLKSLATATGARLALVLGLLTALWSASGYVTAFSRAMNRVYEIPESRPVWKLRPVMLLITLVMDIMDVLVALMVVLSGPITTTIGDAIGFVSTVLTVWSIAKWPVVLVIASLPGRCKVHVVRMAPSGPGAGFFATRVPTPLASIPATRRAACTGSTR